MKTYRLASANFVYAPGMIEYVINAAKFESERDLMIELVRKGWNIPLPAAAALVQQKVPYAIVGETVVFTVGRNLQ